MQTEIYIFHWLHFRNDIQDFSKNSQFYLESVHNRLLIQKKPLNFKIRKQAKCNDRVLACTMYTSNCLVFARYKNWFPDYICTVALFPLTTVILRNNVKENNEIVVHDESPY